MLVTWLAGLGGQTSGQCASLDDQVIARRADFVEVVLIGEEDRRTLTTAEAGRFNVIGRIWNERHGYAAAVFRDRDVRQNPVTASLLHEPSYAVTAAHFFYAEGEPKSPLEEIRFGHGDFRGQRVETYRIVDIEVGTTHPEHQSERDFAIVRLERPAPASMEVLRLPGPGQITKPPARLVLIGYHGDREDGLVPHFSIVDLKDKSKRRLVHGGSWYKAPEIILYGGHTEGGSSGAPLMSVGDDSEVYLQGLNLGFIRCASWYDGHGFNPRCHFNYGIAISGNRAFYRAFRILRERAEE